MEIGAVAKIEMDFRRIQVMRRNQTKIPMPNIIISYVLRKIEVIFLICTFRPKFTALCMKTGA